MAEGSRTDHGRIEDGSWKDRGWIAEGSGTDYERIVYGSQTDHERIKEGSRMDRRRMVDRRWILQPDVGCGIRDGSHGRGQQTSRPKLTMTSLTSVGVQFSE